MKYKKTLVFLVMAVLCAADWYFSNFETVSNPGILGFLSEKELAEWILDPGGNYNGARRMLVIYTIPVLLGIWYLTQEEKPAYLVRFPSRKCYKAKDLGYVLLISGLFSAVHEAVQYIFIRYCMGSAIIEKVQLLPYCFIAIVVHTILYVQTGLVWHILTDVFRSRLAGLLGTFGINFMQYIVWGYGYGRLWLPGSDCTAAFSYIDGDYSIGELQLVLARGILVAAVLCAVCLWVFEKKDLMRDEKK